MVLRELKSALDVNLTPGDSNRGHETCEPGCNPEESERTMEQGTDEIRLRDEIAGFSLRRTQGLLSFLEVNTHRIGAWKDGGQCLSGWK